MSSPIFDVESLLETFFEEAEEHLSSFERGLLELSERGADKELIATIFRAAHSIKGGSGTFGLNDIMSFTHALETVLDRMRNGELACDAEVTQALLDSVDVLRALLRNARRHEPPPAEMARVIASLERFYGSASRAAHGTEDERGSESSTTFERRVLVTFAPKAEFMSRGMDPLAILRDIAAAGVIESHDVDQSKLPDLAALEPETFYLSFRVTIRTSQTDAELKDIFAFVDDLCTFDLKDVTALAEASPNEPLTNAPLTEKREGRAASGAGNSGGGQAGTIRVSTDKIDKLLDLVGELVIAQAMVIEATREPSGEAQGRLRDALNAMERHTRDLQERVMAIRMVPLSTVFRRLPRMVHDLAAAVDKDVKLEIEGESTEIDKSMVEQLVDPLTHLVRNAIDHGLESKEGRLVAGKEREGHVSLRAFHQGGNVVIEVADDGRGLDRDAIRAKAERQRLISADAVMTDEQIHELIFQPGFSTAAKVSDISGRGVGMDVVKRNVEALNGSLGLSTELGRGTRIRMRLPLTLAILDGLAVGVGSQTFIVPLLSVVESFRPTPAQVRSMFGRPEVIDVRGTSLPIVRLHDLFGVDGAETDPCSAVICIVESNGGHLAVLVDQILDQHQVVVKSLEVNFKKVDGLMGATILGDGRVAMIVDVQALSRSTASANAFDRGAAYMPEATLEAT